MARTIGKGSWIITLKGLLALIFGLIVLFYPGLTLAGLIRVFGFMLLIAGEIFILGALFHTRTNFNWGPWLVEGAIDIIIGLVIIIFPIFAIKTCMLLIAIWAILMGLLRFYLAGKFNSKKALLIFNGIITIIFGNLVLIIPFTMLGAFMILIGFWAIMFGISVIVRSFS